MMIFILDYICDKLKEFYFYILCYYYIFNYIEVFFVFFFIYWEKFYDLEVIEVVIWFYDVIYNVYV